MARVPAALALLMAMALSACGSPETPPAREPATTTVEQTPVMPDDAPPQEEGASASQETAGTEGGSCTDSIGAAAATRLAERCTMVSPASHPPCNPDNPCALIQDEIDRACGQYGPGEAKPAECAA
ncbi:MAG: hypothetical protein Q8S03_08585 [Brevundimonas sp.]|uniref:hypothetical protein n=1 Tax=Brevundimonas sp. TaxID=1871086 RepID=UPI002732640B|nr:hypothetical protein [Brevundimonas sp.]MDP3404732.1 hypothetical protein [Brevundimonas sp.]